MKLPIQKNAMMKNANSMLKASILCALLWFALPNPVLGQYYETTYDAQYGQPIEQSEQSNDENENKGNGFPWWVWAGFVFMGLSAIGWLMDDADENQSATYQSRARTRRPPHRSSYVEDPSK